MLNRVLARRTTHGLPRQCRIVHSVISIIQHAIITRSTYWLMSDISCIYGNCCMLDLHKLRIFLQVSQVGSFSAAADLLLMTQSGVSQHIQELENTLGIRLFDRKPRGVALTAAGQTLVAYAEQIFALVSEAETAVADAAKLSGGVIRVGATPGIGMYVLPGWISEFRTKHPHNQIALSTRTTAEIVALLRAGQLDLGIIEGEIDDDSANIHVRTLQSVEQWLVVGPSHLWWPRDTVDLSEIGGEVVITRQRGAASRLWLDNLFKRHKVRVRIAAEFDNVESIKRAVSGSTAISVLPRYTIEQEERLGLLKALRVNGISMQRTIRAVWSASTATPAGANAFLSLVADAFETSTL